MFLRDLALGWLLSTAYSTLDITSGGGTAPAWSFRVIQWITPDAKRTAKTMCQLPDLDPPVATAGFITDLLSQLQLNMQIHMGSPWITARTEALLGTCFSCGSENEDPTTAKSGGWLKDVLH